MEVLAKDVEKHFGCKRLCNKSSQPVYIDFKDEAGNRHYLDLLVADHFDIKHLPTKKNCKLFRFVTPSTLVGGMSPALMINVERNLIYFYDEETGEWESRGCKANLWSENWAI